MQMHTASGPAVLMERLQRAINQHDLDGLAECFAPGFLSEQPAHPDRAFYGRGQVRSNWSQIFGLVPNIEAVLLRCASEGETVWAEWDWRGSRADGAPFAMRGVTVQRVQEDRIAWVRLYMEPVRAGNGVDAAVRQAITGNQTTREVER